MKYLCLIYSNEQVLHTSPDSPADPECLAYAQGRQVIVEGAEGNGLVAFKDFKSTLFSQCNSPTLKLTLVAKCSRAAVVYN